MSKAYSIFVSHKNAENFAKEHNGTIIINILGTGGKYYEVEYEETENKKSPS